jgi:putative FmdB family regulatory protein
MPFYEYECANCKFYTEVMQKISDAPLEKCPSCGKKALKKLVSAPNFRLKGGGWYETDFKSDKEGKRNIADREEPASKAQDAKGGEAKPAAPAEASGGKGTESTAGPESGAKASSGGEGKGRAQARDQGSGRGRSGGKSASSPKGGSGARSKPAAKSASKAAKSRSKSPARRKGRR